MLNADALEAAARTIAADESFMVGMVYLCYVCMFGW